MTTHRATIGDRLRWRLNDLRRRIAGDLDGFATLLAYWDDEGWLVNHVQGEVYICGAWVAVTDMPLLLDDVWRRWEEEA